LPDTLATKLLSIRATCLASGSEPELSPCTKSKRDEIVCPGSLECVDCY